MNSSKFLKNKFVIFYILLVVFIFSDVFIGVVNGFGLGPLQSQEKYLAIQNNEATAFVESNLHLFKKVLNSYSKNQSAVLDVYQNCVIDNVIDYNYFPFRKGLHTEEINVLKRDCGNQAMSTVFLYGGLVKQQETKTLLRKFGYNG